MIMNGFFVRRVMLSNLLASCRRVSLTFLRGEFCTLPAVQAVRSKLNANVPLQRWHSVASCRLLQTTSLSTYRGLFFKSLRYFGTHADEYAQWRYTKTKTNTNPNRYRRCCPDPNARTQKFIHHMATTPQLQNGM